MNLLKSNNMSNLIHKSFIIFLIFILIIQQGINMNVPAADNTGYITRMQAVDMLLEDVILAACGGFTNWDYCYVENDKYGGYDLKLNNGGQYTLIYELYSQLNDVAVFSDISSLSRHDKIALYLAENMYFICGFGDGTFRPYEKLTYAQALSMLSYLPYLGYKYVQSPVWENELGLSDLSLLAGKANDNRPIPETDFISSVTALLNGRYPTDEKYITRIQAIDTLLEAVIRKCGNGFTPWEECYADDGDGGYKLDMGRNTEYPLIYALYPQLSTLGFSDISGLSRRDRIALSLVLNMNLITGFDNGVFHPNDYLTYRQTIRMLSCTPVLGNYDRVLKLMGWDGKGDRFDILASQAGIVDCGPLLQWSKYHKANDPIKTGDFQASVIGLNDIHAQSRVYTTFIKPNSAMECVSMLAADACDKNYYKQYPLCDEDFINSYDFKIGAPVFGTYANFAKYEVTEMPKDINGYYTVYQVKLYYVDPSYEPTYRYVYVAFVNGEYKILQAY